MVLGRKMNTGDLSSLRDAQRFIQKTDGMHVDVETVRRNLQQQNIRAYVQQKRPDLKWNHVQERLTFAREHTKWTVNDWKRVMFSDESIISRVDPLAGSTTTVIVRTSVYCLIRSNQYNKI